MKRLFTLAIIALIALSYIRATEWFVFSYTLPHFSSHINQLLGSSDSIPNMFLTTVKLNSYIKKKIDEGTLKNKPVIYDICYYNFNRQRYLIEVFETPNAYHISINNSHESFMIFFIIEELAKTIDYFTHPNFEPFYCGTALHQKELAMDIFFKKVDGLVGAYKRFDKGNEHIYTVYEIENLKIEYCNNRFYFVWNGKDTGIMLDSPISIPVKFKDRIIFATNNYFYVYENGEPIKVNKHDGDILWLTNVQEESNRLNIQVYSDWINVYDYNDELRYSYCYSTNRFYKL